MIALIQQEIKSFFDGLIGYFVIAFVLLALGLFMWVFPGPGNVYSNGYATLGFLFENAPVIFLLLVPAITMRTIAEDKRNGMIELLLSKPISDFQLVLAKFFASVILVVLALIPTFIYYFTIRDLSQVYVNGQYVENIDEGAIFSSYFGLFLLGSVFCSIGIFASSISNNQVVSFILALLLCFLMYIGFDFISDYALYSKGSIIDFLEYFFSQLSINEHYQSIQKGVLDTRDLIYFLGVILLFLKLTHFNLQKRKW